MATTVLKVKRRRSQSPAEALLVHLGVKRSRREETEVANAEAGPSATALPPSSPSVSHRVFKFAATLQVKSELDPAVRELVKESQSKEASRPPGWGKPRVQSSVKDLTRARSGRERATASASKDNRYRIVSSHRNVDDCDAGKDAISDFFLLDVVRDDAHKPDTVCGADVQLNTEADTDFVYDVYYHNTSDGVVVAGAIDQIERIDAITAEQYLDLEQNDWFAGEEDSQCESDDSNNENNWRNEYPDESDDGAGCSARYPDDDDDDGDLEARFASMNCRYSEALSSSDEDLVYSKSFSQVADLHGLEYAKFKKKIMASEYHFECQADSTSSEEDSDPDD